MSTASAALLPVAKDTNGSSTAKVEVFTVVVSPLTVRFPAIVTLSGKPIVTVAVSEPDPETSISLAVPAIVDI